MTARSCNIQKSLAQDSDSNLEVEIESEFEDRDIDEEWSDDDRPNLPRKASVILRDGRRVRRSITMTSLSSQFRGGIDRDCERGGSAAIHRETRLHRYCGRVARPVTFLLDVLTTPSNRGLVKCVIAYFVASLAVFIPQISDFIGHGDGKHFVATCTVYFHPSRSMGAMIMATLYALTALMWAVFVSTASMATAIGFNGIDQRALGHTVVLIVWVCGGVGYIGYWKQRMGDPTVGVAASMASMVIFFNITREGSLQLGEFRVRKVLQYFFIVLLGLTISNVVNYFLWPVKATRNLKRDMCSSTSQFSQFLSLVTRRFLQETRSDSLESAFNQAVLSNQSVFASLQKNLSESKYEYYLLGRESEFAILARITRSMKNLAQHLNALKASCDAQLGLALSHEQLHKDTNALNDVRIMPQQESEASTDAASSEVLRRADRLIGAFVDHLGPPMKSLAFTTKQALKEMPFGEDYKVHVPSQLFLNIDRALSLYDEARELALSDMYKNQIFTSVSGTGEMADREEIAASMDYFSFSLQEFVCETREMMYSLKELELYQSVEQSRSWNFLKFWRSWQAQKQKPSEAVAPGRRENSNVTASQHESLSARVQYNIWRFLRGFKQTEIRFAIKVGVGAALFAMPAMIDSLRPIFVEWRLEWGLLSFFIILNSSVGGTYSAGFWRVMGSTLGTALAMFNWTLFPGNRYALAPLGALIAAPCMHMIINPTKKNAQFGRFILLSYNLTALYAYSISQGVLDDDDDEGGLRPIITLIALHRMVSVTAGCLWGVLINTYVWPIKARVELREGLSRLWLKIAWGWRTDPFYVFTSSAHAKMKPRDVDASLSRSLELQNSLTTLKSLLAQSPNEPRLRGKFPVQSYTKLIKSTQDILDSTHALNSALQKTRALDGQEVDLLNETRQQRRELGDLIFLYFYLLASAMRICLPLPHRFPSVTAARDRLLAKISRVRTQCEMSGVAREEDYSASFIYSLMSGEISKSLDELAEVVTDLFGQVESFDVDQEIHD